MGTICSSHFSLYRGFLSTRPTRLGEPPPVSLLLWSRGGLVIEEIPALSKVGGIAAKTSLNQLFVHYMFTVMDEINEHY